MSEKRLTRKELKKQNKRNMKKRQIRLAFLGAVLTAILVYVTGFYGASLAYFGDFISSGLIMVQFGDGWPYKAELSTVKQAEKMGNGLCILDADKLSVYSPTAKNVFTYYHSMQNPIIDCSDNRAVIYNANQTSIKIANHHKILFSKEMYAEIIHASISDSNKVAVTTKSSSYNSQVSVYNYNMDELFTWYSAKSFPVSSHLSKSGNTLAVNTVLAQNGYLMSNIYIIDATKGVEKFIIEQKEYIPLGIEFIGDKQVMVIYDKKLSLYSLSDGSEIASYSYDGHHLLSYDIKNTDIALAIGEYNQEGFNKIVLLDSALKEKFTQDIKTPITNVAISQSRVFMLGENTLLEYTLKGELTNSTQKESLCKKVIDYNGTILISSKQIEKIHKTNVKK